MTAPRIRYARTTDGVGIAFWTVGAGPPLVQLPMIPFSHIEMEWRLPEMRAWYERLARGATVVRYDGRGTGLSQRDVADRSLDAHVRDLEAVVDQLGGQPASLLGVLHSGPVALAYAARSPARVARLILFCSYARGSDYWRAAQAEGLRALRQADYPLFLRTASHELFGWAKDEEAEGFAEVMREAATPEEADRLIAATRAADVADALPLVACPTLVVHRRRMRWLDVSLSRDLAARIPDNRIVILEGASPLPAAGDADAAAAAVGEFLGHAAAPRPGGGAGTLSIVLFTDIVGHAQMMSRLGDARGREVLRRHERVTRGVLGAFDGTEVKTMGDGFMASFASVTRAVECAIGLQRAMRDRAAEIAEPIAIRIGLDAGEPIAERGPDGRDDLFGATVILAARIAREAAGGEILVSDTVRGLCSGKAIGFDERGVFNARGFVDPVRIHAVRWR